VGTLGLVEFDTIDASNLQRQILYKDSEQGQPKADRATDHLKQLNPHIEVVTHNLRLDGANVIEIFSDYDVIVDGTDNFSTRYLINDACVVLGKPLVHGSIFRFDAQVSVFNWQGGPCYRCLYREPPAEGSVPNCAEAGVIGVLPGTIGTLQATEAIKIVLGIGQPLTGQLLTYDALNLSFEKFKFAKDPDCLCAAPESISLESSSYGNVSCDLGAASHDLAEVGVDQVRSQLGQSGVVLLDVRNPREREICSIVGSLHIPLAELPTRLDEIPADKKIYVHCKSGGRSAQAQALLKDHGLQEVYNVHGGIIAWAEQIDQSMPKY
jgi:adenylyltransferase/sulfurtransferase